MNWPRPLSAFTYLVEMFSYSYVVMCFRRLINAFTYDILYVVQNMLHYFLLDQKSINR